MQLKRYTCVLACESRDCGPAALATVARHYGLHVSIAKIQQVLDTTLEGTSLTSLQEGALTLGFSASCGKAKPGVLDQIPLPAIAHFNDTPAGHFVAIHRVLSDEIILADPASGIVKIARSRFLTRWSGYLLLLAPSADFKPASKPSPHIKELIHVALLEKRLLLFAVFLGALLAIMGVGTSLFVKLLLDQVIVGRNVQLLHTLGLGVLAVILLRALSAALRHYFVGRLGYRLELALGLPYTRHVLSLPLEFFDKRSPGDVFARVGDASRVRAALTGPFLSLLLDFVFFVSSALLLLWYSPALTTITIAFLPAIIGLVLVTARPMINKERETRENLTELASRFVEVIANIKVLKAFSGEALVYQKLAHFYQTAQEAIRKRNIWSDLLAVGSTLFTSAASLALLWTGTLLVMRSQLTLGQLMFFYSISGMFLGAVDRLAPSFASVQDALLGIERLEEIHEWKAEDGGIKKGITHNIPRGEIEFLDVTFWHRHNCCVLSHIDLKILPGEWLAILGETGSGKSTLACLIAGLYSAREGQLLIDGKCIESRGREWWRNHIAIVFQEPGLMRGTVRDNIAIGKPEATLQQIQEAAKLAQIHDFILSLPMGYEYDVGPAGVSLSSGQRQRIALARALLKDPPILILDEATSNLDAETERQIMRSIHQLRKNRTTLIITHRLTTAMMADRAVVLHGTTIIERGTHRELLEQGGKYYSMWQALACTGQLRTGSFEVEDIINLRQASTA